MTRAVDICFSRGDRRILDGLSLDLKPGSRTVIFGDNGAGKSTLALILAGVLKPDSGAVEGERAALQVQNPADSILTTEVAHELAFPLEFQAVSRDEMHSRILATAEEFGLYDHLHRSPEELSGGMISRVALASSMITRPQTIVLDEPFAFLDRPGRRILLSHLDRMADEGRAILLITQKPEFYDWADAPSKLIDGRLHPMTEAPAPEPLPTIDASHRQDKILLTADGLTFGYERENVLENLYLSLRAGEVLGITGPSGSGKSTLLKLLAGLLKPDSGSITADGRRGIIFQFPEYQLFDETVLRDTAFGPRNLGMAAPEDAARNALLSMGIPESFFDRSPHTLSEGEKRRVGLAGILAMQPDILLLDEPFSALDLRGRTLLAQSISALITRGGAAVLVSHDERVLEGVGSRPIFLDKTV